MTLEERAALLIIRAKLLDYDFVGFQRSVKWLMERDDVHTEAQLTEMEDELNAYEKTHVLRPPGRPHT